jgi:hypothetical protein
MALAPGGIDLKITGLAELGIRLHGSEPRLRAAILEATREAGELVADQAKENITETFENPSKMMATISSHTNVAGTGAAAHVTAEGLPYLAIHEFGGVVNQPELFPHKPPFALIVEDRQEGHVIFASHVQAHEIPIPERSYLRRAIDQKRFEVLALFRDLV